MYKLVSNLTSIPIEKTGLLLQVNVEFGWNHQSWRHSKSLLQDAVPASRLFQRLQLRLRPRKHCGNGVAIQLWEPFRHRNHCLKFRILSAPGHLEMFKGILVVELICTRVTTQSWIFPSTASSDIFMVLRLHFALLWTSFRPSLVRKPSDMFSSRIFFLLCQFFCFLQLLDEPQELTQSHCPCCWSGRIRKIFKNTVETLPRQYFPWKATRGLKSCPTSSP